MGKYKKTYSIILDNMDLQEYRLRPISAIMYVQDAFARFTATKKIAAYDLFPQNLYWVITELNIEFLEILPFWSEEISIEIWFSEFSKLKIYSDFNILYKDQVIAKGNSCWFILDTNTKRPIKLDQFSDKIKVCNEFTLGEHKKFILPNIKDLVREISHKMNLSDIDFNRHVNNKSYINIAEMTAGNEFKEQYKLKELNIKYNKETFLDDTVICSTHRTDIPNCYAHILKKDEQTICEICTTWEPKTQKEKIIDADLKVKKELVY